MAPPARHIQLAGLNKDFRQHIYQNYGEELVQFQFDTNWQHNKNHCFPLLMTKTESAANITATFTSNLTTIFCKTTIDTLKETAKTYKKVYAQNKMILFADKQNHRKETFFEKPLPYLTKYF